MEQSDSTGKRNKVKERFLIDGVFVRLFAVVLLGMMECRDVAGAEVP